MPPRRDEGYFSARDNTRLYWQSTMPETDPVAFVGVVHGYGDHLGRYAHVVQHLVSQGISTLAFDYRGHGRADGRRTYCAQWAEYVSDLEVFWARLRGMAQGRPTFLLAHSHGGLVALHWVLKRPEGLKGLVLSAPLLRTATDPPRAKVFASKAVGLVIPWLPVSMGIPVAALSRDEAWQKETAEDPLYVPNATPRWFVQATEAMDEVRKRARDVEVPLLMLTAGDDAVVSTPAARAFFDQASSADKTYREYPGYRHEVLNELGKEAVLDEISRWISARR